MVVSMRKLVSLSKPITKANYYTHSFASMNALKITYRVTTGLVTVGMLIFFNYMFNQTMKIGYVYIGFPDWFRVELGIAKLLGAIALIVQKVSNRVKEWAYFVFFVNFFSAILAHYAVNDPVINIIAPLVTLILPIVSYITYHQQMLKPNATVRNPPCTLY